MLFVPIAVLSAAAAVFLASFILVTRRSRRLKSWPTATGTVIKSSVPVRRSADDSVAERIDSLLASTTVSPVIRYRYTVDGQQFTNDRIGIGRRHVDRQTAAEVIGRYPEGSEVTVSYDPENPRDSVLETSAGLLNVGLLLGFLLTAALAVVLLVVQFA